MTDHEVGELWNIVQANDWHIKRLIRKLVEEREQRYRLMAAAAGYTGTVPFNLALKDFGIPPEDWK